MFLQKATHSSHSFTLSDQLFRNQLSTELTLKQIAQQANQIKLSTRFDLGRNNEWVNET